MSTAKVPLTLLCILYLVLPWPNRTCHAFSNRNQQQLDGPIDLLPRRLQFAQDLGLLVHAHCADTYVLGTVHIGSASAEEAVLLIETLQPKAVVLEVAPSRLPTLRRRWKQQEKDTTTKDGHTSPFITVFQSLPALVEKGWSIGGIPGAVFATIFLWGSLWQRAWTAREESTTLPRVDEFGAALAAADRVQATVYPTDVEIDALLQATVQALSWRDWWKIGNAMVGETLGWQAPDPIRRQHGESLVQWETRRRNIVTARASRSHSRAMSEGLHRVLVQERDARFAQACRQARQDCLDNEDEASGSASVVQPCIVCIVGLMHLDGVVRLLQEQQQQQHQVGE